MVAHGANILLVEANEDVRDILAEVLRSQGHEVRIAEDGWRGLRMLHERLPDVLILDVEMPHLSGPEMVYRMILHDAGMEDVPIVLVSGIMGLREVARRVGTPYFVGKPFDIDKLMDLIDRALVEKTPPRPTG